MWASAHKTFFHICPVSLLNSMLLIETSFATYRGSRNIILWKHRAFVLSYDACLVQSNDTGANQGHARQPVSHRIHSKRATGASHLDRPRAASFRALKAAAWPATSSMRTRACTLYVCVYACQRLIALTPQVLGANPAVWLCPCCWGVDSECFDGAHWDPVTGDRTSAPGCDKLVEVCWLPVHSLVVYNHARTLDDHMLSLTVHQNSCSANYALFLQDISGIALKMINSPPSDLCLILTKKGRVMCEERRT